MEFDYIKFDDKGLITAVIQDFRTKEVLMTAYMNEESLNKTIETSLTWFYSRSRQRLWQKGETSGNVQNVKAIKYDCDGDCLLISVQQQGPACHTGNRSCFYREIYSKDEAMDKNDFSKVIDKLYKTITDRKNNPKEGSYTNYLLDKGIDKILKKVAEETGEVIIAAKNNSKEEMVYEISDLIYHLSVLMVDKEISYEDIAKQLSDRVK